jgi:hypothetical protein
MLERRFNPHEREDGGCSAIQYCLRALNFNRNLRPGSWGDGNGLDSASSRNCLKPIRVLAKHGAKWVWEGMDDINAARRSLLRMTPDYTIEFVWIMSKYQACSADCVQRPLSSGRISAHTAKRRKRLE